MATPTDEDRKAAADWAAAHSADAFLAGIAYERARRDAGVTPTCIHCNRSPATLGRKFCADCTDAPPATGGTFRWEDDCPSGGRHSVIVRDGVEFCWVCGTSKPAPPAAPPAATLAGLAEAARNILGDYRDAYNQDGTKDERNVVVSRYLVAELAARLTTPEATGEGSVPRGGRRG